MIGVCSSSNRGGLVSEEPRARVIAPKSHDAWYRLLPRLKLPVSASSCNALGLSFSIAPAFFLQIPLRLFRVGLLDLLFHARLHFLHRRDWLLGFRRSRLFSRLSRGL